MYEALPDHNQPPIVTHEEFERVKSLINGIIDRSVDGAEADETEDWVRRTAKDYISYTVEHDMKPAGRDMVAAVAAGALQSTESATGMWQVLRQDDQISKDLVLKLEDSIYNRGYHRQQMTRAELRDYELTQAEGITSMALQMPAGTYERTIIFAYAAGMTALYAGEGDRDAARILEQLEFDQYGSN